MVFFSLCKTAIQHNLLSFQTDDIYQKMQQV